MLKNAKEKKILQCSLFWKTKCAVRICGTFVDGYAREGKNLSQCHSVGRSQD